MPSLLGIQPGREKSFSGSGKLPGKNSPRFNGTAPFGPSRINNTPKYSRKTRRSEFPHAL
ncbi:MAG: hypothetical protein D6681_11335 [Calditrichaeota bacterium]|nr:MAG: hypothetical protein D6681_11335 [Calditrichota bacterium]